jgi:hypothetical protein
MRQWASKQKKMRAEEVAREEVPIPVMTSELQR